MKVYFSYWWDPPGKKEFSALKYTPKRCGKWKNLTLTNDLEEADVVVVFDVCCDSEKEYLLSGNTGKKILWFTREPPDIYPGNLTRDPNFREQLESRGIQFYDYLTDDLPLLSTWHVHGDYDYYSDLEYQEKSSILSTIISHKSIGDPVISQAITQGVQLGEFESGLSLLISKLRDSYLTEESFGRGYSARKLTMLECIKSNTVLDVYGRINDTALVRDLSSYLDESNVKFSGSLTPENKKQAYKNYHYSLVFENSSHVNYFSEKINDCFLEWSMPIYWGCKNIEKYFPEDSLIKIEKDDILHPDEIVSKLKALNKPSKKTLDAIRESRDLLLNKYNLMEQIRKLA